MLLDIKSYEFLRELGWLAYVFDQSDTSLVVGSAATYETELFSTYWNDTKMWIVDAAIVFSPHDFHF